MPKPVVWFDLDGVLADFDKGVRDLHGKEYRELDAEEKKTFWTEIAGNGFYTRLEVIPKGEVLYREIAEIDVDLRILTSTGGGVHHNQIAADKAQWCAAFLPDFVKPTFCAVPGAWIKKNLVSERAFLIDDNSATVDEWHQGGGVAYWFTEAAQTQEWVNTIRRMAGRVRNV